MSGWRCVRGLRGGRTPQPPHGTAFGRTVLILSGSTRRRTNRGGKASDHDASKDYYNWRARTRLLASSLDDYRATPERWLTLFRQTATPANTDSSAVTPR